MTGSPSMPGLTPKAIDELFRLIAEKPQLSCKVRLTQLHPSCILFKIETYLFLLLYCSFFVKCNVNQIDCVILLGHHIFPGALQWQPGGLILRFGQQKVRAIGTQYLPLSVTSLSNKHVYVNLEIRIQGILQDWILRWITIRWFSSAIASSKKLHRQKSLWLAYNLCNNGDIHTFQ